MYVCMYVYIYTCIYTYVCVCIYIYTYIHICVYICIYAVCCSMLLCVSVTTLEWDQWVVALLRKETCKTRATSLPRHSVCVTHTRWVTAYMWMSHATWCTYHVQRPDVFPFDYWCVYTHDLSHVIQVGEDLCRMPYLNRSFHAKKPYN